LLRLFQRRANLKARLGVGRAVFLMRVVDALAYYETRMIATQASH